MKNWKQLSVILVALLTPLGAMQTAMAGGNKYVKRPGLNALQAYTCDPIDSGENSSKFVNDGHRFVIQTTNSAHHGNLNCGNEGGIIKFVHSVPFDSVSVLAKFGPGTFPCDVDVDFFIDGNPNLVLGFCLGEAVIGGTTPDGYTLYSMSAASLGLKGALVNTIGLVRDRDNAGFINLDQLKFNTHEVQKNPIPFTGCPFIFVQSPPCP